VALLLFFSLQIVFFKSHENRAGPSQYNFIN
jgi:hypothetical protein